MNIETSAKNAWLSILDRLHNDGVVTHIGRLDIETKEILNNSVAFDMNYPIINHPARKIGYKFLAAEAYAICHGDNRVENLAAYNSNIAKFSDDDYIFNGAYGPPFNNQLMYVVNNLASDTTSRQAVLTIWKQNPTISKDVRCTLSLQFMIRDGKINTFVNMRSSDAIWGICYDFSVFTFMTIKVLTLLNEVLKAKYAPIQLGTMYWNGASSHIYEHHYDLVKECLNGEDEDQISVPPAALTHWKYVTDSMHACLADDTIAIDEQSLWAINPNHS